MGKETHYMIKEAYGDAAMATSAVFEWHKLSREVVDATAKYPTGFFQATASDLGAYDECIETVVRDEYGTEKVRAQYCDVHISIDLDDSMSEALLPAFAYSHRRAWSFKSIATEERSPGIRLGVCFINACNEEDLANIARTPIYYKCVTAFSVVRNSKLLLAVNKDDNSETRCYKFMHGLRFLGMFWICLGHSYATLNENISRLIGALAIFESWESPIVSAGFVAVDTFFFMRGTIPMFFMIMCIYLLPLIASGPNSKEFYNRFYAEVRDHWWHLLVQIRNWRSQDFDVVKTQFCHLVMIVWCE
ncbi:uncharacterized protein LOC142572723 [Dermacentor variabilis]|uniref:uncharacterized protein LOC142572723 n=1 Tax=Dermacentor variabilis TaxID=34621 RepID=UPI003F5B6020